MSHHQRHKIHPAVSDDSETPPWAPPSAPPVPSRLIKDEEKINPVAYQHEKFVDIPIQEQPLVHTPSSPSYRPSAPPPLDKPRRRGRLCKCLCYTLLTLVLLVIVLGAIIGILYLVYKPKFPNYSVDRLRVTNFTLTNTTATATLNVTVTATNPNKKIGIEYKDGSSLTAWYNENLLASGSLPEFYQGHRNTTVVNVLLSGKMELSNELLTEFDQQQKTGEIPLTFRGSVPVRVKFGSVKFWKVTIKVRCNLVVNSLSSSSNVSIKSSSCKFSKLKLFG